MNVVVLTNNGSFFGRQILLALRNRDIRASAVVIRQPLSYSYKLFRSVARRNGLADTALQALHIIAHDRERTRKLRRSNPSLFLPYDRVASEVRWTRGTNHDETLAALRELRCDLLVLGQCGIVRKKILDVPKRGTLNAHPGILPDYRGIDSCRWAILNKDWERIGATVHWVDRGVDTGPIIRSVAFSALNATNSDEIEDSLFALAAETMGHVVEALAQGEVPSEPQPAEAGRQYYKMNRVLMSRVEECLAQRQGRS